MFNKPDFTYIYITMEGGNLVQDSVYSQTSPFSETAIRNRVGYLKYRGYHVIISCDQIRGSL